MGGNARESFRYHLVCDRARLPGDSGEGNGAAVAIGERTVLTKLHRSIREHRLQRRAGRKTSFRRRPGFTGSGRERDFDTGEANLAPSETAAVGDRTNLCRAGSLESASGRAFRPRGSRRQHHGHAANPRKSDVPAPAHAATKPSE